MGICSCGVSTSESHVSCKSVSLHAIPSLLVAFPFLKTLLSFLCCTFIYPLASVFSHYVYKLYVFLLFPPLFHAAVLPYEPTGNCFCFSNASANCCLFLKIDVGVVGSFLLCLYFTLYIYIPPHSALEIQDNLLFIAGQ